MYRVYIILNKGELAWCESWVDTSPQKTKQTEVHSDCTVNNPLAGTTSGPHRPMRGSDLNPPDQSEVRIWLLTRRRDSLDRRWGFRGNRVRLRLRYSSFSPPETFTSTSKRRKGREQTWRYRNGREKRAYFCAFSVCFCLFTRCTSSCPERATQITGRCATWPSLWAAPKFSPPGMFAFFSFLLLF